MYVLGHCRNMCGLVLFLFNANDNDKHPEFKAQTHFVLTLI